MKRSNGKRHRPEEVVANLRQADEPLAKDTPSLPQISAIVWPVDSCARA